MLLGKLIALIVLAFYKTYSCDASVSNTKLAKGFYYEKNMLIGSANIRMCNVRKWSKSTYRP